MSTTGGALAHRSVANIRTAGGVSASQPSPGSPHTPQRNATFSASTYGSPSSIRAEEDVIIIDIGARRLRTGFAGDNVPRCVLSFGPEQERRVGDFRNWDATYWETDWRPTVAGKPWGYDHELYQLDIRGQDLDLVGDKLERALRDGFRKYLMVDSKPRRMTLILPPAISTPLLSTIINTIFNQFQSPTVSLLSSPVMAAVAAGVRSALIVDIGWAETVVTGVYEYREVQSFRSVRAGKMLLQETAKLLEKLVEGHNNASTDNTIPLKGDVVSFKEAEEVVNRLLWCKSAVKPVGAGTQGGLPTVHEQDESIVAEPSSVSLVELPLWSCIPRTTLHVPFPQFSEPCETTFFETKYTSSCFDDHELPIHTLVYQALLRLPVDVRATCMPRIIFTGGCANIPGLKGRIYDELSRIVQERGWDRVQGAGVEQLRSNPKVTPKSSRKAGEGPTSVNSTEVRPDEDRFNSAEAEPEKDAIEDMIRREKGYRHGLQGELRVLDSLGAWCGASLASQMKVPAVAVIDREIWLQHGASGAVRPSEVDAKLQQRQSLGAGGLMRGVTGASQPSNWTLGAWGSV